MEIQMTPFELVNTIHREISAYTPKLAAAVNKALLYYGDGSALVGLEYGKNRNDELSFEESEAITVKPDESSVVMLKVMQAADLMESHSAWRLIVDVKPAHKSGRLELRYTLIRNPALF